MEDKFKMNNNINNLSNDLSNINTNNSNLNQNYSINSSNTQTTQYYSKKKNPRDMTVEELEEYIQKNRAKMNNYKNKESHSLNASFNCHYDFGFSDKVDKEDKNTFSVKRNNNIKHLKKVI